MGSIQICIALFYTISYASAFRTYSALGSGYNVAGRLLITMNKDNSSPVASINRRSLLAATVIGPISMGLTDIPSAENSHGAGFRKTNEVVSQRNGILQKRLGHTDLVVSEIGVGTQRWVSGDFNGPDEKLCFKLMDKAILNDGINLLDTAEQYPIPSDKVHPEGLGEEIIGRWISSSKGRRDKVVIATKITGGTRISKAGIADACEGSLRRLKSDYIDLFQFHWPARYTPQSNWGQSLEYKQARTKPVADCAAVRET